LVGVVHLGSPSDGSTPSGLVDVHAVEEQLAICGPAAVDRDGAVSIADGSAHILSPARDGRIGTNRKRRVAVERPAARQRVENLAGKHVLRSHLLGVDKRVAPLTVTVSSSAPKRMSAFTVAVKPAVS